jgi:hypothetical protein
LPTALLAMPLALSVVLLLISLSFGCRDMGRQREA